MVVYDLHEFRKKKYKESISSYLWDYEGVLIFDIIPSAKPLKDDVEIHDLPIGNVFLRIYQSKDELELSAILFPFDDPIDDALDWLATYEIRFNHQGNIIHRAEYLIEAISFKGIPILLVEKGIGDLEVEFSPEDFTVTESF